MTFEALSRHPVFVDQFALGEEGDIRHISLADAADLLLVAPATANTLGKFARGIADDALSTLYLATTAPVLVAPAMNVNMFDHPAVRREPGHPARARGAAWSSRASGYLACGWLGKGRLAESRREHRRRPAMARCSGPAAATWTGETVLVTAGPTVEDIDPVRFLSNRSSGRMGYRAGGGRARSRRARGARVRAHRRSAARRRGARRRCARRRRWPARSATALGPATIVAMAAAVSDYRPAERSRRRRSRRRTGGHARWTWCGRPTSSPGAGRGQGRGASWSASRPRPSACSRTRARKRAAKNARPDGRQRRVPRGRRVRRPTTTRPC